MARVDSGSSARRQLVHTETRSPVEVVLARVVSFVFGAIEVLIAMRFVLLVLGANEDAAFVAFVYELSAVFMVPFNAVLATQTAGGAIIEWSALIALAVYALLGWGAANFIRAISPRRSAQTRIEETEDADTER